MTRHAHPTVHRSAFSLLELMIVTVIFAMIILVTSQALDSGSKLTERLTLEADLNSQANQILNDLALELRTADAIPDEMLVDARKIVNGTTVTYKYRVTSNIGAVTLTDPVTLATYSSYGSVYEVTPGSPPGPATDIYRWHVLTYVQDAVNTGKVINGTLSKKIIEGDHSGNQLAARPNGGLIFDYGVICDKIVPPDAIMTAAGKPTWGLPDGGFSIKQIGDTLQLDLTLQTSYVGGAFDVSRQMTEQIIHASDAQVLFLRSTLNQCTSASPQVDPNQDPPPLEVIKTAGPMVQFGNRIIELEPTSVPVGNRKRQIPIYVQAPVGETLPNPPVVTVTVTPATVPATAPTVYTFNNTNNTSYPLQLTMNPGASMNPAYPGLTFSIRTNSADRKSANGNYNMLLEGVITGPMNVRVDVQTVSGRPAQQYVTGLGIVNYTNRDY